MSIGTNEPAFPVHNNGGMTLRDYFAGQALAGIITAEWVDDEPSKWEQRISITAYAIADAMIAERAK